ncbi:myb-like dna-binding [Plasmopara halstedii]|uniref:Myb-like dna-binding n=1 Tax=Plasmopara halstedii TaxID=4781 RepID=A0A0N7L3B9_PLAHL|nr:myb-like dna-binding [Plasmopara halstedii]CEG35443.1 myb-like dna-binding [Plasmopara halstedii]|eukprot:XP_024571812.1 myb-like dna-binding [Plasmopara halstedii]
MSFGMAEQQPVRAHDHQLESITEERKIEHQSTKCDVDGLDLATSPILELDRKNLLIVKDGTVRVAESLDREQQQFDTNGEVIKASGTWTKDEHDRFLRAMETFPKGPWKVIAEMVATRTVRQTQTHAQKYREKIARRMRGLRNRNGTLQTPPMSFQGMAGYHPYTNTHTHVYQHGPHPGYINPNPAHLVSAQMGTIPLSRASSLPAMPLHRSSLHHHSTTYSSTPMSASFNTDFNQLSTSTISNAFLSNASYPASWGTTNTEVKPGVPDFDESMDFLMDVYSTNPNQITTISPAGQIVTPTACNPRTPQTPTSSMVVKRHPGYGYIQQPQSQDAKYFTRMNNDYDSEREAKGI